MRFGPPGRFGPHIIAILLLLWSDTSRAGLTELEKCLLSQVNRVLRQQLSDPNTRADVVDRLNDLRAVASLGGPELDRAAQALELHRRWQDALNSEPGLRADASKPADDPVELAKAARRKELFDRTFTKPDEVKTLDDLYGGDPTLKADLNLFKARQKIVALAGNPQTRELLVRALSAELDARSEAIQARLRLARQSGTVDTDAQVYDAVNVGGGGVHGTIFALNYKGKMLQIESSNRVSDQFARFIDFFRINSSNRQSGAGGSRPPERGT